MHIYNTFVQEYARLLEQGKRAQMGGFPSPPRPVTVADASTALIFSPHPDDECIIGALPLRLLRQAKMRVINVAVTQGSKKERQQERLKELKDACGFMGYDLMQTQTNGLERVNPKTRAAQPALWGEMVKIIADILKRSKPFVIFFPHKDDWNSTHIGTHLLVTDALASLGPEFRCFTVETEFWGQNSSPNLMVQSSEEDVADMVAGTSFHVGEVTRNPFHLFLPAWMQDNVRRGSELVGGQGEAAPDWPFATLYRLRCWEKGSLAEVLKEGKSLAAEDDPMTLFTA